MCGIAGIFDISGKREIRPDFIPILSKYIIQRGEDDTGYFHDKGILISSARLAIIDVKNSKQPFETDHSVTAFNGQIYNYKDLKKNTAKKYRTNGDTEFLCYFIDEYYENENMKINFHKLDGPFAICHYNKKQHKLFLIRDIFGERPLYYMYKDGFIIFSSDIRTLYDFLDHKSIDQKAMLDFFFLGFNVDQKQIFSGIKKLSPSSFLHLYQGSNLNEKKYFSIHQKKTKDKDALNEHTQNKHDIKEFTNLFDKSVQRRLVGERKFSLLFSGGKDSTSILTSLKNKNEIDFFHLNINDYDSIYTQKIIDHFKLEIEKFDFQKDIFSVQNLEKIYQSISVPFADRSFYYLDYICKQTKNKAKVFLSGDGGDELFYGYARNKDLMFYHKLRQYLPKNLFSSMHKSYPFDEGFPFFLRFKSLLGGIGSDDYSAYFRSITIDKPERITNIFNIDFFTSADHDSANYFRKYFKSDDFLNNCQEADLDIWLPSRMLVKTDLAIANNSCEIRTPFLEKDILSFAKLSHVQKENFYHKKKIIDNYLLQKLPKELVLRKKQGFIETNKFNFDNIIKENFEMIDFNKYDFLNKNYIQTIYNDHRKGKRNISLLWNIIIWDKFYSNLNDPIGHKL